MKTIGWVVHGRLKANRQWKTLLSQLTTESAFIHVIRYTEYAGHGISLSVELSKMELAAVVAVGGDGTINECANGIVNSGRPIPMGIVAMGTGNDFVKALEIAGNWEEIKRAMSNEQMVWVDLGKASFVNREGHLDQRYFINVLDIGIGGEVVQRIAKSKRRLGPFLTYQKSILATLLTLKRPKVQWQSDVHYRDEKTLMLAIANAKWFGSGLGIAPVADIQDGILEVIHLGDISIWDYFRQLPHLRKGVFLKHPQIRYDKARQVRVFTPNMPIDCDGEFIGFTPLMVQMIPRGIRILRP
jgi:diacylglycerol kinase (ATP)